MTPSPSIGELCIPPEPEVVTPIVTLSSLPSSLLYTGEVVAMKFTVSAPEERIALRHLTFMAHLNTSSYMEVTTLSDSSIRRTGEGANIAGGVRINNGSSCYAQGGGLDCLIEVAFSKDEIIPASSSRTYELRLNAGGIFGMDDSLSTRLLGDDELRTGELIQSYGPWDYRVQQWDDNFVWYDMSDISSSSTLIPISSEDWRNGAGVSYLPSDPQALVR